MALMMDNKPTEYKGEALVWEKLSSLLPNDVVVYNHREVVDDREFDFALLIKNVGINPTRDGILHVCREMGGNITLLNENCLNNGNRSQGLAGTVYF